MDDYVINKYQSAFPLVFHGPLNWKNAVVTRKNVVKNVLEKKKIKWMLWSIRDGAHHL